MKDSQPVYVNGTRQSQRHEPDSEVLPRAKPRQFSAEYKLRILVEADQCTGPNGHPGSIGALLRREGLYSSHLDKWRTLFCDSGDTLHGTYPALKTQGESFIPVLNTLGTDAVSNSRRKRRGFVPGATTMFCRIRDVGPAYSGRPSRS